MTPARLIRLMNAFYKPMTEKDNTAGIKRSKHVDLDIPAGNQKSLVQYFNGGG